MEENNEIQQDQGHFSMPVNDIFHISGRGYVFCGCIASGTVHIGDEVTLSNGIKSFVNGIEMGQELFDWATKGENPGLLLGSIAKNAISDFDNLTVEGIDTERNHCEISVIEQSPVKGNGINVKGKILSGSINVGDPIIISKDINGNIFRTITVDAIEIDGQNVQSAKQGDMVTLNFKGLTMRTKCDKVINR
jgi:translation elongation factor EF-Tu-like GTPase